MRNYYDSRKAHQRRQTLKGIALIGAIIAFGVALFPAFDWLDCYNANKWHATYIACKADVNCTPSAWQDHHYERKGAWKAHYCARED